MCCQDGGDRLPSLRIPVLNMYGYQIMVKRYLELISLNQALAQLTSSFTAPDRTEVIPLMQSIGRVVAAPLHAPYSVPEVSLAAMDGIAVRSRDTTGASDQAPVTLPSYARVNTGNVVPPEFDAVVMIEDTWETDGLFQIRKSAPPHQHIRPAGEDIREGRLVLPRGHVIRPFDIGALATYGITSIVVKAVRIGIIPTGSELVPIGTRPKPGQVVESNTLMAEAFLSQMGATCTRSPIVPDDPELIRESLHAAAQKNDLVIISAGSSAGTRDFTESVIRSLGDLLFHGVAMKPGKPVMLGKIGGTPVLGLPGYPLAAQTVLREFAAPLLEHWGFPPAPRSIVSVRLAQPIISDIGFDEFVPVFVGRIGKKLYGTPHAKGPAVQMTTIKANGYCHIPAPAEGYEAGTVCEVFLTTDPGSIERTLFFTGSIDPALEELAAIIQEEGVAIHATNPGNIAGLIALQSSFCHAAPLILPAQPGPDAMREIARYLNREGVVFVHIATIGQGIASKEGFGPEDLSRIRFINTKTGTPGRTILDTLLKKLGSDPSRVNGYLQEVHGPHAVAAAICDGFADAGMCTSGIAHASGLKFVPLAREDYELAIRRDLLAADPRLMGLIARIQSPAYRSALQRRGGYDTEKTGMIRSLSADAGLVECPLPESR